ncbi:uncharacterized protein LOC144640290 [Oculina patagonica]
MGRCRGCGQCSESWGAEECRSGKEEMGGYDRKCEEEGKGDEKQRMRRLRVTGNGHLEDVDDETKAKLLKPCTENLNSSEKEMPLLGPQTFTGIPGRFDSLGMSGEDCFCC